MALLILFLQGLLTGPVLAAEKTSSPNSSSPQSQQTKSKDDQSKSIKKADQAFSVAQETSHPSGKDRSVEPGNSFPQGHSPSDPDNDGRGPDPSNGGPDKPGGNDGVDKNDQDGNNGCGNDNDFEDDNEGLCLGRVKRVPPPDEDKPKPPTPPSGGDNGKEKDKDEEDRGGVITAPPKPPLLVLQPNHPTPSFPAGQVLGAAGAPISSLPITGLEDNGRLLSRLVLAFALILIGIGLRISTKERRTKT